MVLMDLILRIAVVVILTLRVAVCSSGRDAKRIRCVVSQGDRTTYLSRAVYIEVVVLLVGKMITCGPTLVMTVCWLRLCFVRE